MTFDIKDCQRPVRVSWTLHNMSSEAVSRQGVLVDDHVLVSSRQLHLRSGQTGEAHSARLSIPSSKIPGSPSYLAASIFCFCMYTSSPPAAALCLSAAQHCHSMGVRAHRCRSLQIGPAAQLDHRQSEPTHTCTFVPWRISVRRSDARRVITMHRRSRVAVPSSRDKIGDTSLSERRECLSVGKRGVDLHGELGAVVLVTCRSQLSFE